MPLKKCKLPSIDKSKLLKPEQVTDMNQKFFNVTHIRKLAVKLAEDAYFGEAVMKCCMMKGITDYHPIPEEELNQLKIYLHDLCVPRLYTSQVEWENAWKACHDAIGQKC